MSSRASGADIVGIEEGEHNAGVIAQALGWHASERTQVISRFPIVDPPGANGIYVWVEVLPGRFVAIGNVHLPSDPYGPYEIRDGASLPTSSPSRRRVRLPAIQDQLAALPPLAAGGMPTFLTGDFNSPSHLDWTAAVSAVRPEVPYPVDWPVSHALADAGLRDSYREVHPDPLAVPGFTWTPGGPESDPREVHDRIDWVLSSGPATALDSDGRRRGRRPGRRDRLRPLADRPSRRPLDVPCHAGGPLPLRRAVERGGSSSATTLDVRYRAAAGTGPVGRDRAGGRGAVGGRCERPRRAARRRGTGRRASPRTALAPGAYDAILVSGGAVLSRNPFWLYAPGTPTTVWTSKPTYMVGEPIDVSWAAAPGFRWDWLAVYKPGDTAESPHSAGCNAGCSSNGGYLSTSTRGPRSRARRRSMHRRSPRAADLAAEARDLRDPLPRRRQLPLDRRSANFKVVKP